MNLEESEFRKRIRRIEALLQEVEQASGPAAQPRVRELVQSILDLHAEALARVVEHLSRAGEAGRPILHDLARDGLLNGLLLLHGIHPLPLETRVRLALERVRPPLRSHGVEVDLLDIAGAVVRLQLRGSVRDWAATDFQAAVEEAISEAAPEATQVEVEALTVAPPVPAPVLLTVEELLGEFGPATPDEPRRGGSE